MSFKIDRKKVGSINDGGRRLKVGKNSYRILSAVSATAKNDLSGREKQVEIDVADLSDPTYVAKIYLSVNSDNDVTANIAQKTLVGLYDACEIDGEISDKTLKKLVDGTVDITASETTKGEKTYINIVSVESCETSEEEEEEETEEEETEEEEEKTEEEEEETPTPPARKPSAAAKFAAEDAKKKSGAAPDKKKPW